MDVVAGFAVISYFCDVVNLDDAIAHSAPVRSGFGGGGRVVTGANGPEWSIEYLTISESNPGSGRVGRSDVH
jgi:hypothetical protein